MKSTKPQPVALTVAGSDSGGDAGVQADLRAFEALGVHGASAITALTCQNAREVIGIQAARAGIVALQIRAVCEESRPAAVKTGMLANAAIVAAVARELARWRLKNIVVDPVMVSSSGHRLLSAQAVATLRDELLPLATLVTPNLDEARALLGGGPIRGVGQMWEAAAALAANFKVAVLVKGGHLADSEPAVDVLCERGRLREFRAPRVAAVKIHGSGCIYSAAITAWLARGAGLTEAVRRAKSYVTAQFQSRRRV
ncbi:MAG: bifunctional hydroxymethylpyrimidine kinase/phosphomethylpyrimidine kinase [Verrucomicrobia bacterium]|nr:bifunctional hydroxymethylpyrimidine kinase/phosphomethylpyrimidine kinase [Verrucomicrobiota bacterium]